MSRPRPYDLSDPDERERLIREVTGYMKVNLHSGTDWPGRSYAYAALVALETGLKTGDFEIRTFSDRQDESQIEEAPRADTGSPQERGQPDTEDLSSVMP